jgi:hypothetical protein
MKSARNLKIENIYKDSIWVHQTLEITVSCKPRSPHASGPTGDRSFEELHLLTFGRQSSRFETEAYLLG